LQIVNNVPPATVNLLHGNSTLSVPTVTRQTPDRETVGRHVRPDTRFPQMTDQASPDPSQGRPASTRTTPHGCCQSCREKPCRRRMNRAPNLPAPLTANVDRFQRNAERDGTLIWDQPIRAVQATGLIEHLPNGGTSPIPLHVVLSPGLVLRPGNRKHPAKSDTVTSSLYARGRTMAISSEQDLAIYHDSYQRSSAIR
jgi:hypothetical protein